jgi:hypothetical protein
VQPTDLTTLVHLVGFLTGIALYAMLDRHRALRDARPDDAAHARRRRGGRGGVDRIPLATAALGLVWNRDGRKLSVSPEYGHAFARDRVLPALGRGPDRARD